MSDPTILSVLAAALEAVGVDDAAGRLIESADVTFAELDVDSLATIEIVARLGAECGIDIPDEALATFERPADIVAYCRRVSAPA